MKEVNTIRMYSQRGATGFKEKGKRKSLWHGLRRDKFLYLLMLPGLVFFILFKYVPMWGIVIAFQDYSPYLGVVQSKWVGFEHFNRLFLIRISSNYCAIRR